jgi:hypothetical protein
LLQRAVAGNAEIQNRSLLARRGPLAKPIKNCNSRSPVCALFGKVELIKKDGFVFDADGRAAFSGVKEGPEGLEGAEWACLSPSP